MGREDSARNRLSHASSPYLRQHAGNPVHWQAWDDATLAHARETDTPILLSIGYSACHWCHVMAHECFEDPGIAAAMNRAFVNVKLDREERPDLDRAYQLAHQALSGRGGGWPLTAFLDPQDLAPFYIGTYFPPAPRHGLPGFPEVLQRVRAYFDGHRGELRAQAAQLRDWLQHAQADAPGTVDDPGPIRATALQRITARFDTRHGGNAGAPKFPRAPELEWLLDLRATHSGMDRMANLTLANMAARGLQDHLGGGFFRYCVDADWTIPHFEKMLYDNAQLLPLYARLARAYKDGHDARLARAYKDGHDARLARAYKDGHDARLSRAYKDGHDARLSRAYKDGHDARLARAYKDGHDAHADAPLRETAAAAAQGIVDWLAREMTAANGALFSSLDADSEHAEGKYYLWTRDEVGAALDGADVTLAEAAFGLDGPPNFEGRAWHLLRAVPRDALADRFRQTPMEIATRLEAIRQRLFDARAARASPARDDKILTAWNALAIAGLARSARLLDDARCAGMARRALDALRETTWIDGRLYANAAEPAWRIAGFLDDHAFLLDALLETMQLDFDPRDLEWAIALADALLERFDDAASGAFRFSTPQHATPLAHDESWMDDALPNGNAVAIRCLLRLGHLLGDARCLERAARALQAGAGALRRYPDACPTLLRALHESVQPRPQIVVRCPAPRMAEWRAALQAALRDAGLAPGGDPVDAFLIPADAAGLPGVLAARLPDGNGVACVCTGSTCGAPVTAPGALAEALRAARAD